MRATARPSPRRGRSRPLAALLAGLAALALAAAGAEAARASEPSASSPNAAAQEAPMCRAPDPEAREARARALRRIRQRMLELRAQARAEAGDREGVVLDGRGLRYRGAQDVMQELDRVHAEARRP